MEEGFFYLESYLKQGLPEVSSAQEKGVKKINGFFVKKTVLSELGEFTVFRKNE